LAWIEADAHTDALDDLGEIAGPGLDASSTLMRRYFYPRRLCDMGISDLGFSNRDRNSIMETTKGIFLCRLGSVHRTICNLAVCIDIELGNHVACRYCERHSAG